MNYASLHVCISIIQTNHYIYSIIFIYELFTCVEWRSIADVLGCEDQWQAGDFGDFRKKKKERKMDS